MIAFQAPSSNLTCAAFELKNKAAEFGKSRLFSCPNGEPKNEREKNTKPYSIICDLFLTYPICMFKKIYLSMLKLHGHFFWGEMHSLTPKQIGMSVDEVEFVADFSDVR